MAAGGAQGMPTQVVLDAKGTSAGIAANLSGVAYSRYLYEMGKQRETSPKSIEIPLRVR